MPIDYGSGALGNWPAMEHYNTGNLLTADALIVGDSITVRGRQELEAAFAVEGKTVAVNAWSGRPSAPAIDWILEQDELPPLLIFACFSNDVCAPNVVAAQLDRLLNAELPGVQRILVVDTQIARPGTTLADQRNSGWINAQIRDRMRFDSMAEVVPWAQWFASSPVRITQYLDGSGIHPIDGVGTNFWAEVIMKLCRLIWG